MIVGINAGFGDPIAGEFPFFERIGVAAVRQDLFAHGETASIEALVAEFSNRPARAVFMLAGGKMQVADGSNRIEPHVLAARARRVVEAARAVGLQQYSLEVGNEPDIAHDGWVTFEQWIEQARQGRSDSSKVLGGAWATVVTLATVVTWRKKITTRIAFFSNRVYGYFRY
jgi:hypothetical protein